MSKSNAKILPLAIVALIALIVGVLMHKACSSSSTGGSQYFGKVAPPEGQTLRYISGAEPETLDPEKMTGQPESRIAVALFDGLVEYDEKTEMPRPSLAMSWETNADSAVWTFHLRSDAKWTDGAPLNARDFVYSWRRALSPALAASYAYLMYYVKGAQEYNSQMAFVRDPATGKFATEDDLKRAGANGEIRFTADAPTDFSAPADKFNASTIKTKYLFVPADADARDKLLNGDPTRKKAGKPELARFVAGKDFVPVKPENVGVRAIDDYTLEVTLERPTAFFIKLLPHQFFRPVPRQAIERWGDELWIKQGHIVTSGAFRLTEWTPYERIVVERNPLFWDNANTKLDKIIFPSIEELTTAMNLYKAGEVDATESNEVPPPWRKELKETVKDFIYGPYLQIEYLAINTRLKPFDDVRVRKALSMAINRQILADQAPGRQPLTGFTPQMEGYETAQGTDYNPEEARRLLAEAGYPDGKGFPKVEILYNTAESNKQNQELVQSMLKRELHIQVELVNEEFRTYLEDTRNTKLNFKGLARRGWIGDYVDPDTFLGLMTSDSDNNGTGWSDPKYDAMMEAANSEPDPAKRMKMLHDAEAYMLAQQPVIPLFIGPSAFMRKPYVKNLLPNLLDQHDWRNVYIDHDWKE
jgi:oligopeptide transport system substrate-binding protein